MISKNEIAQALSALESRIATERRTHKRASSDYRILTEEVQKVRDLRAWLNADTEPGEPKDNNYAQGM